MGQGHDSNSVGSNLINKPTVLGLDPLVDVQTLEIGEEQQAMLVRVLHGHVIKVNANK